jgi:hypothetical protein
MTVPIGGAEIESPSTGAAREIDLQRWVRQLWEQIRELPRAQRIALLLNLRAGTSNTPALSLLPLTGLATVRESADELIDTSNYNIHQLASQVVELFSAEGAARHTVTLMSFGFKYGLPPDADLVADMRFLPNPFWNEDLRPLTGEDDAVRHYVLEQPGAQEFVDAYAAALTLAGAPLPPRLRSEIDLYRGLGGRG